MKKVARSRRFWLVRKSQRHQRKAVRVAHFRGRPRFRLEGDTLIAPDYFCLLNSGTATGEKLQKFYAFLRDLREFKGKRLCVDMSGVSRLIATAALLFKAELSYLSSKGVQLSGLPPKKSRSHQVIAQTGIAGMLGIAPPKAIDREDTIHWKHTGGQWEIVQPSKLAALLDRSTNPNFSSLFTGMVESVANCIEHAYENHPARRNMRAGQEGWWGFQQIRNGTLTTCICDLGIGIANALPISMASEQGLHRKLLAALRHHKGEDVKSILAAIEYGRSSTGEKQRGKGLRDAHRVIDDAGQGHFQLMSNRGFYYYTRESREAATRTGVRRLQGSISGTVYYWEYPIESPLNPEPPGDQGAVS